MPDLQLVSDPTPTMGVDAVESSIFLACAVTRAAAKRTQKKAKEISITVDIRDDSDPPTPSQTSQVAREDGITEHCPSMKRQQLIKEQQCDVELSRLAEEAISEEEMANYVCPVLLCKVWGFDEEMETPRRTCIGRMADCAPNSAA